MLGVLALVATFRSSGALASAYGIAVTGTMGASAVLAGLVAATCWGWGPWRAALVFAPLLLVDLAYLAANSLKVADGGWFPLAVALAIGYVVAIWRRGRGILWGKLYGHSLATRSFIAKLRPEADPGEGHGRVHDRQPGRRPERAPAQPQAQQGAARARAADDGAGRRRPVRAGRGPGRAGGAGQGVLEGGRPLRLHGPARQPEGAGRLPGAGARRRPDADLV